MARIDAKSKSVKAVQTEDRIDQTIEFRVSDEDGLVYAGGEGVSEWIALTRDQAEKYANSLLKVAQHARNKRKKGTGYGSR